MGLSPWFVNGYLPARPLDETSVMKWVWQTRTNWGEKLLAIWLLLTGLLPLLGSPVPNAHHLLAILAVAAGVLLLLRR